MGIQYFQINCKYCSQRFGVQAENGKTVKCKCPFCGKENIVAAPLMSTENSEPVQKVKPQKAVHGNQFGRKMVIGFLIFVGIIILLSTILYIVFKAMSN